MMTAKDLKNALLQEAIQGKLVPQIESEGSARELLEEIRKYHTDSSGKKKGDLRSKSQSGSATFCREKINGVAKGDVRSRVTKNAEPIAEDEIPFEIPENWCWCRLGEICSKLVDGDHNPPSGIKIKTDFIMASSRNINEDKLVDLDLVRYLTQEQFEKENERTNVQNGDIFFTGVGTLGRSCIYEGGLNICFQRSVSVLHTEIYNLYLKYCFDSPLIQNFVVSHATGTAQKGFYLNQLAELLIPLPPLAEQKRIVAAIERFMPLIEEYGIKEAALATLNADIAALAKKAVLQEAIQGKLVPQIESEGSAREQLEEIRKYHTESSGKKKGDLRGKSQSGSATFCREKINGVAKGDVRSRVTKNAEPIAEDEIPFEIPENWCWCRLGEIFHVWSARRVHQSDWKSEGIPFYRAREIGKLADEGFVENDLFITEELYSEYSKTGIPEENDLMVTAVGTLGKAYIVKKNDKFYYKDASVISFKNIGNINPFYAKIVMDSNFMHKTIKNASSGTTVGTITIQNANNFLFPLPPLAEQKRIVAALERLLPLCEKLGRGISVVKMKNSLEYK